MKLVRQLEQFHLGLRSNRWNRYFTIFCRIALAAGFLPSGFVKVNGERFTALATTHPMGSFLEAFYHTGFYYTFVGVMQMTAAVLLLIPRTATVGAILYFPIILNIFLLSYAVRFDGSLLTSPLMVLACLYLLVWDWHKIKFLFFPHAPQTVLPVKKELSNKFPVKFFTLSVVTVMAVLAMIFYFNTQMFMPRIEISECKEQCPDSSNPQACLELCDCLHTTRSFNHCVEEYDESFSN